MKHPVYDILSLTNSTLLTADTILWCTKNSVPNWVSFPFPLGKKYNSLLFQCPLWSYVHQVTHIRNLMKSAWTIFNKGEKNKNTALHRREFPGSAYTPNRINHWRTLHDTEKHFVNNHSYCSCIKRIIKETAWFPLRIATSSGKRYQPDVAAVPLPRYTHINPLQTLLCADNTLLQGSSIWYC